LRNRSRDPNGLDDGKLETIAKVAGLDMPSPEDEPLDKERTLKDAADWLRHNDLDPNTVNDATLRSLANMARVELPRAKMSACEQLACVPIPKGSITPKSKEKFVAESMKWLRKNEPKRTAETSQWKTYCR
jgi:hypothetical protein